MKTSRQLRIKLVSILLGLAATLCVTIAFYAGALNRFELLGLDFRFRYFNNASNSNQLCIVGIDDSSLESIGEWPWPRTYIAKIITTVKELGSRDVLIDLIFRKPRADKSGNGIVGGNEDSILANACRKYGGVVLACFFERADLTNNERKLVGLLADNLTAEMDKLARKVNVSGKQIRNKFATIRRLAARRAVLKLMMDEPTLTKDEVFLRVARGKQLSDELKREITEAYHYVQSYMIIREKAGWVVKGKLPASVPKLGDDIQMVLPIPQLAANCGDVGFVSFKRDIDGKVRELQLLAYYRKRIYRQIAFATVCDELGLEPKDIRMKSRAIELMLGRKDDKSRAKRLALKIPLTDEGKVIVNWYAPEADYWQKSFKNIVPAGAILEFAFDIERREQYKSLLKNAKAIIVKEFLPEEYGRYIKLTRRVGLCLIGSDYLLKAQSSLATQNRPTSQGASAKVTTQPGILEQNLIEEYRKAKREIGQIESKAIEQLDWLYGQVRSLPVSQQNSKENQSIRNLWLAVHKPQTLRAKIVQLEGSIDKQKRHLKPMVENKIVLLGYTASTLADFVSTPVFKQCPGIMVHANILNQILQQSFLIRSDYNSNLLLILTVGMLMSLISSERSSLEGFAWLLFVLIGFYVAGCFILFRHFHIIVPIVAPTLAVIASWMSISIYREATEGRTRRLFANRLRQYTNDSLVKRIIEDPDKLVLIPEERDVSCFFSDLAGFTSLSEKLGPEQTVRLLNIYLEHMSEVLDRHHAFINKFQGDGIFAFFNPPLNPQSDYAVRACRAAIESQEYLPHIRTHLAEQSLTIDRELEMRIGISSGKTVVGDCGSTRKFDYTCLGDTVNLASRLESANKFFGTKILICSRTKELIDEADSGLMTRLIGKIKVVGKEQATIVYELIGEKDSDNVKTEFTELFEQMVESYWAGEFERVEQLLSELTKIAGNDKGVKLYRRLIAAVRNDVDEFNDGIISLESK